MYLSKLTIENFRCFGESAEKMEVSFTPGLTALVGANDAGKTAIIDALRLALGTSDQDRQRLEDSDFHGAAREIRIICKFEQLDAKNKATFVEYLSYGDNAGDPPELYYNWSVEDTGEIRKGRPYRRVHVCSGKDGTGPTISPEVRLLMQATYLRPLRDAEEALSAGRGSRLAQVLRQSTLVKTGAHAHDATLPLKDQQLSILGIANLITELLGQQKGVHETRGKIDSSLTALSLQGDLLKSTIKVSGATASDDSRLRELLEKLDLRLDGAGKLGLGSDNLLFMACELLLLAQDEVGNKLLLIEEPEAHLHAQRQLQVMRSLQEQAKASDIQVIVTTHSPNLASVIDLSNLVIIRNRRAFALAHGLTALDLSDYRFLERFLDVTKANLFFAYGVVIVEGDAENILLPTLARLIGCDLTRRGISIVNVGGVGLRRYARIFQRKQPALDGELGIRIACLTDMDVMPDCAPLILGKITAGQVWPELKNRRWRAKKDIGDAASLIAYRTAKVAKLDDQAVRTFVSDVWTLEYDLSLGPKNTDGQFLGGLAEDIFVAAHLADHDEAINAGKKTVPAVEKEALEEFAKLKTTAAATDGCTVQEIIATHVYAKFATDKVSKPIAAQYLSTRLQDSFDKGTLNAATLRSKLPHYLTEAIDYILIKEVAAIAQEIEK
jgi:putative ATP-dependent endonuclease of the OLD family